MKKALATILAAAMLLSIAFAFGCSRKPRRETGDIDVDYGKLIEDGGTIMFVKYEDDTPISFMYPNYFRRSSDEEDPFVAKGPDDNSVLMYEPGELGEGRSYDTIASYTDDEAKDWMTTIQLGLVESQGISSLDVNEYRFEKLADHLYMELDATATYSTGLRQNNHLVNCIMPDGRIYTLHAFAPVSAVEKYGPLFKDVLFKGEPIDGELPAEAVYLGYDTGNISFSYRDIFSITANEGRGYAMNTDHKAMLAFEPHHLIGDHTYEELKGMANGDVLNYMAELTAIEAGEADFLENVEEDGHLRLEAHYSYESAKGTIYVVAVQFVFPDGTTQNFFAYADEPAPAKDIVLNG